MELFSSPNLGTHSPWIATTEVTLRAQSGSAGPRPASHLGEKLPPIPSPPPVRVFTPSSSPSVTTPPTSMRGPLAGLPAFRNGTTHPATNDRLVEERGPGGMRPRLTTTNSGARVACYKCQGWGHFASQCPSPRQATRPARALLVEIHDEDLVAPPGVDEPTTEVYAADPDLATTFEGSPGGIGCIIKELLPLSSEECSIALTAPLGTTLTESPGGREVLPDPEDPLRTSIFSTFTKLGSVVIKIIVDSGSVVNAVAAASVHSLGLQPLPHPRPYKAMWINEAFLAVTKRCIVPLQVAGYHDNVWCDILPMGVGSVLLG